MRDVVLPVLPTGTLRVDEGDPARGAGVRIVVIDSGVHLAHPHIGHPHVGHPFRGAIQAKPPGTAEAVPYATDAEAVSYATDAEAVSYATEAAYGTDAAPNAWVRGVAGGVGIDASGALSDDFTDRLGHGTAVTAAIREKAPAAEIWIARVFDRQLSAPVGALVTAIDWAVARRAHLINLSLGTANAAHEPLLRQAVQRAREAGAWMVAAGEQDEVRWLPGALDEVIAVTLDWTLPREMCTIDGAGRAARIRACGYPRPIPGVPPERNLKGLSFAVANATGLLAAAFGNDSVRGVRL